VSGPFRSYIRIIIYKLSEYTSESLDFGRYRPFFEDNFERV